MRSLLLALFLVSTQPALAWAVPREANRFSSPAAPCEDATPLTRADQWLRSHLQSLSPQLESDTLHIAGESPLDMGSSPGTTLGSEYQTFFWPFYGVSMDDVGGIAVVLHWSIDEQHEGYVLRVPGEYGVATEIWTYDLAECVWDRRPVVSNEGGDGGYLYRWDGWLVDLNGDGYRDLVQRRKGWSTESEQDQPTPSLVRDQIIVYYWSTRNSYFAETYVPNDTALRRVFDFVSKGRGQKKPSGQ